MTHRGAQQVAWRYTCLGCCSLIDDRVVLGACLTQGSCVKQHLTTGSSNASVRASFTRVVSSYARCVASCVTYDMSITHPTIHVRGSQRGKKKMYGRLHAWTSSGLESQLKKGQLLIFLSHENVFGRPVIREQHGKNFMESIGRMSSYGLLNFSDML